MTTDPRCFFCNVHLIPTLADVNTGLYFCGGEPVCICGEDIPHDDDDHTHDLDRLNDDGNPHTDDDDTISASMIAEYEWSDANPMPAWYY